MVTFTVAHVVVGALTLAGTVVAAVVAHRLLLAPQSVVCDGTGAQEAADCAMSTARTIPAAETSRPMLYLALTKPDVSFLVVMTTLAGFYLGSRGALDWLLMAHTVFGTTLVAAGTSALNHFIERGTDAHMRRTAMRPLPSGQLSASRSVAFGLVIGRHRRWFISR